MEDQSGEQAIQESREIARAILETAVDAIITIDAQGLIESLNPAAEQIFGYTPDELIGYNVNRLMPQPYRTEHDGYIQHYLDTAEAKIIGIGREVTGLRKDGREFPMELAVSEVRVKGRILFAGIVRDISDRKAAQNALQREIDARRSAEDALRATNKRLEAKAEELQEATRLKSEFLANMSHELRTPMNSIIGFSARVIKKAGHLLPEKQLNNMKIVQKNAEHLLLLINDILDLSKIEAGKMELLGEEFSASELVGEVSELSRSLVAEKGLVLQQNLPQKAIALQSDKTKLMQILLNLLGNAIKFTEKGEITITVSPMDTGALNKYPELDASDNDYVEFSISDTGIGMTPTDLQYIFEAFRQVDGSLARKSGGSGLGLAISKNLAELLGGALHVKSEKGVGTVFSVAIPTRLAAGVVNKMLNPAYTAPLAAGPGKQHTILCVDDNPEVLALLQSILTDEGYRVLSALSADEGIRLAREKSPSLITLDVMMPEKDGWQALEELKMDERTQNIPVITITFAEDRATAYKLGAADYISKPITPEKLETIFGRVLAQRPQRILAVDDDESTLELTRQLLEDAGVSVMCATNGSEAIKKMREQTPDLVLLDLIMPEMDGFETIRMVQADDQLSAIPICVMSAKELTDSEREFLRTRVKKIVSKQGTQMQVALKDIMAQIHDYTNSPAKPVTHTSDSS